MALLKYTLLRLALLAATAGVLYLVNVRGWVLLFAAFLISGIISIFVLNRARNDVSTSIASRQQRINERMELGEDEPDGQPDREA
jgi:membrane protein implicated in regulation of membrane protease activity